MRGVERSAQQGVVARPSEDAVAAGSPFQPVVANSTLYVLTDGRQGKILRLTPAGG